MTGYAELQVTSNFSFLRGASHPEELIAQAAALGLDAIAIADRNSLAGIVRAHVAAQETGLRLVIGCRLDLDGDESLLCFPTDRAAYARLTRLLTLGKRRAPKGECRLGYDDLLAHGEGQILVALADRPGAGVRRRLERLRADFGDRAHLALTRRFRPDEAARLQALADLAVAARLPTVATNDVLHHVPERRMLQDVLTCIRAGCTIDELGFRRERSADRFLKSPAEMTRLFARHPEAVARTLEIVARCRFSLAELAYQYPDETIIPGLTAPQALERLAREGADRRYPEGVPVKVARQLRHELALIAELGYAPYFLTVHRIVAFARSKGILCQGRGSAANSAVCFCLGITEVDPARHDLLFERFVSAERREPPDIDIDFEHERREEVIQHVYRKYGRERAALAASVIRYRPRLAIREVGKALGLSPDTVDALSRAVRGWGREGATETGVREDVVREAGLDPSDPILARALALADELVGFPRHLSQHVGGFVIARGRLDEIVPVENAAMPGRTVIEWDKDDLDALRIFKIDLLALGMLTCLSRAFEMIARRAGRPFGLGDVPPADPATYAMIGRADTVGVFQIESRAQMATLPRLRPETLYDLTIAIALIRPGPIQGDMVHPYLRRRQGKEEVDLADARLRRILGRTLGVPLFQEQAMRIAIDCAGFAPGEADRLRRAMATFRAEGEVGRLRDRFVAGMVANGYARAFAERCFRQIEGFGSYGFPESHAASFALLAYASAWIKRRHPAVFLAAILNSQPMGFYAPAQLVRDAREHDVAVRPVDVNASEWDCTLEAGRGGPAVRLGLRLVKGFREADAIALAARRGEGYRSVRDAWERGRVSPAALERLARADAWGSVGLSRREALWQVQALGAAPLPLFAAADRRAGSNQPPVEAANEPEAILPPVPAGEAVMEDYRATSLSLKAHPLSFPRGRLHHEGLEPASALARWPEERRVAVAGLVLLRQRPGTASGVVFATIEDETGVANVVLWPSVFERFRKAALGAALLGVRGRVQREGIVVHLVAERLVDLSNWLREIEGQGDPPAPVSGVQDAAPLRGWSTSSDEEGGGLPFISRDFR